MEVPTTLRLADGRDVPHEVGTRVYNFYDMLAGTVERKADRPEPDTSGRLPNGEAWWVTVRHDDGSSASLDGSRMVTLETAKAKGWE